MGQAPSMTLLSRRGCGLIPGISFLLLVTFCAGNDKDCSELYIGGSRLQPQVTGRYLLQTANYNNRLVYLHTCGRHVLHVSQSQRATRHWAIGPEVGSHVTYVVARDDDGYPRDVTSWLSFRESTGRWEEDSRLFVTCKDARARCRSLMIRGPDVLPDFRGPYDVYGSHNNRVSYRHHSAQLFLYHYAEAGCEKWVVGPTVGGGQGDLHCDSGSQSVLDTEGRWTVIHGEGLTVLSASVSVECVAYPETLSPSCGRRLAEEQPTPYILQGEVTYPGKWPAQVSYRRPDGVHKCGGVLLGKSWVVTAGHCVSGADTSRESVTVGAFDLEKEESTAQTFRIKRTIIHPNFLWILNPFRLNYDVAVIELDRDVTFTDYVQPACLPAQKQEFPFTEVNLQENQPSQHNYTSCYISGWGKRSESDRVGGKLTDLQVRRVTDIEDCARTYYSALGAWIRQSKGVCLFGSSAGRMCKGDSGSPMFCQRAGRWTVLGLGGWSPTECLLYVFDYPSVYTDLSFFSDWFIATMYGRDT